MTNSTPIRIMLVDDHAVVRDGVASLISQQPDMLLVASVNGGDEALAALDGSAPDLVLLDVRMPGMDGLETLRALRARRPWLKVIMLSGHSGDELIFQALKNGASGYLLKSMRGPELLHGIRDGIGARPKPSPEVAQRLAERTFYTPLSEREVEVLRLAAQGESNKQIGVSLGISENTVKNHLKSIMVKLGAADRTEAVTIAIRRGVIDLHD